MVVASHWRGATLIDRDEVLPAEEWSRRWRVARKTVVAAASWIVALPSLARFMHWSHRTASWVQTVLGTFSGLVWGRIGWIGVRHYGFSQEDAFLAGGLAGILIPTFELTMRRLGWPPRPECEGGAEVGRPSLAAYPLAWFWGFLVGGLVAALGAWIARGDDQ
jgi:hypothetical protein